MFTEVYNLSRFSMAAFERDKAWVCLPTALGKRELLQGIYIFVVLQEDGDRPTMPEKRHWQLCN